MNAKIRNMGRTAIYKRQSLVKDDSVSLDAQERLCRKLLNDDEDVLVYSDQKSGKDTNRESFQKMMSSIERGEISKVVVYKVDRL